MSTRPHDHGFESLKTILASAKSDEPKHDFKGVAVVPIKNIGQVLPGRILFAKDIRERLEYAVGDLRKNGIHYDEAVLEFEKQFIIHVLREYDWNQCHAAAELGMHRNTLSRTIKDLKLDVSHERALVSGRRKNARRAGIQPGQEHKSIQKGKP